MSLADDEHRASIASDAYNVAIGAAGVWSRLCAVEKRDPAIERAAGAAVAAVDSLNEVLKHLDDERRV